MTTRNGKIARLPKSIRDVLCQRLSDGQQGKIIVAWLNDLPTVQSIMADEFSGRPVNEQNLTEWKHGGYVDWLRQQEALELASRMHEEGDELTLANGGQAFSETISTLATIGLARLLREAMAKPMDTAEGYKQFLTLAREITRIRRVDQRAALMKLEQDKRADNLRNRAEASARQQQAEAEAKEAAAKPSPDQQRLDQLTSMLHTLKQLSKQQDAAKSARTAAASIQHPPSASQAITPNHQEPGTKNQEPLPHQSSTTQHPPSSIQNHSPDIQHPPSSIQDQAPSTLPPAQAIKPNQTESNSKTNPAPTLPVASPTISVHPRPPMASPFHLISPHSSSHPNQSCTILTSC